MRLTGRVWRGVVAGIALATLAAGCVPLRRLAPVAPIPRQSIDSAQGLGGGAAIPPGHPSLVVPAELAGRGGAESSAALTGPVGHSAVDLVRELPIDSAVPAPLSEVAAAPTPPPIVWDLEVEANAARTRVAYFSEVFSGRARPAFELALSRQTRFAGMIGDRLRANGLPQDLTYLALIESWYNPDAYSKAAAVGMWQFMAGTARGVGLRVDWWVDERRDPVRSTEGAVRLLGSLHDAYGSFFLAVAAYNGGSGRVSRGLAQFASRIEPFTGEDRFFALSDTKYLRTETRDYVPKLIAAALVAKQPDKYSLTVDSVPAYAVDSVWAPGGAPIPAIARAAGVETALVTQLNLHLLRGMVPPGDSLWVRVPTGTATDFESRYAALDSADRVALTRVVSKKGESITSIARKHALTAKQLNWFNPQAQRLKSGNLVAGQPLFVPSAAVVAAARDVPNPSIERYPQRTRRPVSRATTSAASKSVPKPAAKPVTKPPAATQKR